MPIESTGIGAIQGATHTGATETGMSAALISRKGKVDANLQVDKQIVDAKSQIGVLKADIGKLKSDLEDISDKKMRGSTLGFINAMKNIATFVTNTFTPGKPFMSGMLEWRQDQKLIKDQTALHDKLGDTVLAPWKESNANSFDKKSIDSTEASVKEKITGKETKVKALESSIRVLHTEGDGINLSDDTNNNVKHALKENHDSNAGKLMNNPEMKEILRTHVGKEFSPENFDFVEAMRDALGDKPSGNVSLTKLVAVFDKFVPKDVDRQVNVSHRARVSASDARAAFVANPTDENANLLVESMLGAFKEINSLMNDSILRLKSDPKVGIKVSSFLEK